MGWTADAGHGYQDRMPGKTITLNEVARRLGFGRATLYRMLKDGRFSVPHIPATKPRRWSVKAVDAWADQQ